MNRQASLSTPRSEATPMPPLGNVDSARAPDDAEEAFDVSQVAGINYRKGTVESDQMVLLLATVKSGCREVRRTQLWNNFYTYMCCVIGASIVTRDSTMSLNDIYLSCYTRYVSFFVGNYFQIIHSGHGLFQNVPDGKIPDIVLEKSKEFLVRDNPGEVPTNLNSVVEGIRVKKGKEIWEVYKEAKREVVNVCNLLVREIKSGENKTGVLLEIREKLFALDQQKKREARFKRVVSDKAGKGI